MRALGYRAVDMLVDHYTRLPDLPVFSKATLPELQEPLPEQPAPDPLLRLTEVVKHAMLTNHPGFLAFIPSPSNFVSVIGDLLTSGYNLFAGTWLEASGAAQIELVTIDWLRQLCGLPDGTRGLFVSGGSVANLTALAVARERRLDGAPHPAARIYTSDQTHSSILRAVKLLGFQEHQLVKLPSDDSYRLNVHQLSKRIHQDRVQGLKPFAVVANAGTVNTGAVDPLLQLSALCRRDHLWLHVDGAYGAGGAISRKVRSQLAGLELADSLTLDGHKWLFQPYELGCVLVREGEALRQTFAVQAEYLTDLDPGPGEVNFCDLGIQLTRSFRALKLWLSLQTFGREAFEQAVDQGVAMCEWAQSHLQETGWEIVTPAQLAILTFAPREGEVKARPDLGVTTTMLRGRRVYRLCTIHPGSTREDVARRLKSLKFQPHPSE